jgi:hypothetical protein
VILMVIASPVLADTFGDHWYDGKAELDGYQLAISRYSEQRTGTAVMVFVTEPFSRSKRVKVDDHQKNPNDVVTVMKLNLIRDFQTGIYDYNTMVSVFSSVETLEPLKVTFSSAEWCGHVFAEMTYAPTRIEGHYNSYFEGESGPIEVARPKDGVSEDNLFILLRGLRGDYLGPGESRTIDYLPGAFYLRLRHDSVRWTRATISRASETDAITVPAGEFDAIVYAIEIDGGRQGTFHIEAAYPHRIVRWSLAPDVVGELTGSARLSYWALNSEGDESYLQKIGLESRSGSQ